MRAPRTRSTGTRTQKKVLIFESEAVERAAREFPDLYEKYGTSALFALRSIAQRINDYANEWLAPLGLSAAQYNHLVNLRFLPKDGLSMNELSAHVHTTNASVTVMINALEKAELVKREQDPDDGRSVLVKLTPKGRTLINRAIRVHHEHLNAAMHGLSIPERRTLFRLLTKVADGFERHMDESAVL
jgi:DNA-binding MarR family transcriptional regulator